jgi:hypothetical protein
MADDEEDGGFLAMDLGSSDIEEAAKPEKKLPRDHQSQEDYEAQKSSWKPIIEKGEVSIQDLCVQFLHLMIYQLYKDLNLPISNPSKQQFQIIMHAIEQLYFYRRYREASDLAGKALQGELAEDHRRAIASYQARCIAKLDEKP